MSQIPNSGRLLKLCYEYPPIGGGGAKVAANLLKNFNETGQAADLVTMAFEGLPKKEPGERLNIFRIPCFRKVKNICTPFPMAIYLLRAIPFVLKLVRQQSYYINHTHFIFPDGILAYVLKKLTGLIYVVTAHGSDVPGYNPDRFKLLHVLLSPLWRPVVKNASAIICPSAFIESLIKKKSPDSNTVVIPNGIDTGMFRTDRLRKKRILVVTRIFQRKGIQYFLQALEGLEHEYEVCIVGDGPYLDNLKALAESLQLNVVFCGFLDNASEEFKELFETSEIFVFTSTAENFPIVLLEAMTAGLAIISSNDTGCREAVGNAALTVQADHPLEIRQALKQLISAPALKQKLGELARNRVETLFDERLIALQHQELYRRVLESQAGK